MSINYSRELNSQQYLAVTSQAKHLRIIAGAGTGKTRVLTYRLAHLIADRHIYPSKIVAITFTNKVAREMKDRVNALLTEEEKLMGTPLISTFHGFCYRFLTREIGHMPGFTTKFQIADDEIQHDIYKTFADHLGYKLKSPYMSALVGTISNLKTRGIFPEEINEDSVPFDAPFKFKVLKDVYQGYQDKLRESNLLDFDDLLMFTLKILKENPSVRKQWQDKYRVFLVDEFQDTNRVQYDLVKLFMNSETELAVVGDPDQTIYTWRGADNNLVKIQLAKDFPDLETVTLDENYRSTQSILDMANKLIKNNSDRLEKNLVAANKVVGDKVEVIRAYSQDDEAKQIASKIYNAHRNGTPYSKFAIIYRSNFLSRALEQALSQAGIPYRLYGALKFYERAEIKDALAYFRLLVNPDDIYSFARMIKAPNKGIGDKGMQEIANICEQYSVNPLEAIRDHLDEIKLTKKAKEGLNKFITGYESCLRALDKNDNIEQISVILKEYLQVTDFMNYVIEIDRKKEEKEVESKTGTKFDNVQELLSYVHQFMLSPTEEEGLEPSLEDFLILIAIQSAQDEVDSLADAVMVMTAHISKGLEFPCVFVTGLAQCVFPSNHAVMEGTKKAIEEERRLFYVAMTRAKEHLTLSYFGGFNYMQGSEYTPSMFLRELDVIKPMVKTNQYNPNIRTPNKNAQNEYERIQRMLNNRLQGEDNNSSVTRRGLVKQDTHKDHYEIGDKCVHSSFGIGEVKAIDGDRLTVDFGQFGTKILMNGFKAFKKLTK